MIAADLASAAGLEVPALGDACARLPWMLGPTAVTGEPGGPGGSG